MTNAVYPKWKQRIGRAGIGQSALDLTAATLKVALIDLADYTYDAAHEHFDDIPSGAVVAEVAVANADFDVSATLDADDPTFPTVSGDEFEAVVLRMDTGDPATSPLVAYIDTGVTGLPFTPSGGDVTLKWGADGIFDL